MGRRRTASSTSGAQRDAFTLIELLVVVAIIALLISIVFPALAGAKASAQRVRCGTNIRNIMAAMIAYANDNDEALPLPNWASQDPAPGWLYAPYLPTYGAVYRQTGTLWRYLNDDKIYRCPTHLKPYHNSENLTSYLVNGAVCGYGALKASYQVTAFRPEALLVWEADEPGTAAWNDGSSYPDEGMTRRHGDGATLGGIDGHTEWMTHAQYAEQLLHQPGKLYCNPGKSNGKW